MLEGPILHAVVLEQPLLLLCHFERLDHSLILKFQRCLCSPVLDKAQGLQIELRIVDEASTSADGLIGKVIVALVALVVDLNELNFSYEAKDFYNVAHNVISGYGLDELYGVVRLEVCHSGHVLNLSNDFEILHVEDQLRVNVDLIRYLSQGIFHEQDVPSLESRLKIHPGCMLHEEGYLRFVVC